jgi:RNA polymerase sigma-70 factor (ECF subfamily)
MMSEQPLSPEQAAELVRRIIAGDASAEADLARLFAGRLFEMALARTHAEDAAKDVAQQTLLVVIEALRAGRLQQPDSLPSFVYGTAANVLRHHRRDLRRRTQERPVDPADGAFAPEDEVEAGERREALRNALAQLDPTDREVLLLTLIQDLTPREIARRLGLRADAVRQRKHRALQRIADLVAGRSRSGNGRHL